MSDVADTEAWLVLVWSLVLLVSGLALNIAAVVLLLRSAGNCHRDSSVPALLSLLASNILHCLLVQVFSVHQQVTGSFLFTEKLCTVIQTNHGILSDVGFPTCCLQLVMTLRGLRKLRKGYTYCELCCSSLATVSLPWLVAATLHTLAPTGPPLAHGHCSLVHRPSLLLFTLRHSLTLALPSLLLLLASLSSLPSLCSRVSSFTCKPRPLQRSNSRDILVLLTMVLVHLFFQCPRVAVEALLWYRGLQAPVLGLVVSVISSLPLLLPPLALLTLRPGRGGGDTKAPSLTSLVSSPEENMKMIVSMDGKELETALFASKTTIL